MEGLGLLGLALLAFGGGGRVAPAGATARTTLPPGPPAPWPVALPPDLPSFPGGGWEYDEPPPRAVQARAGQLVSALWRKGKGSHQTEQTAGRWITYRAEIVRSGKQGVVAYRLKPTRALPSSPGTATTARAPSSPSSGAPAPAPSVVVPVSMPEPGHAPFPVPGGVIYTTPAPAKQSPLGLPVLRKGRGLRPAEPDGDVKLLQQKLGLSGRDADGRFGEKTEELVKAFQMTQALNRIGWSREDVDGVVGPKTWTALFANPWIRS